MRDFQRTDSKPNATQIRLVGSHHYSSVASSLLRVGVDSDHPKGKGFADLGFEIWGLSLPDQG